MRAVLLVIVAAACGAPAAPSLSNATQAPSVPADPRVPFHIAPGDARTAERATAAAAQMCACRDRACIAAANQAWEQAVEKLPHGFVDLAFGRLITCRSNLETRLGNP